MKDWHNIGNEIWKAKQRRKAHAELNVGGGMDDRWKDRAFIILLAMVRVFACSVLFAELRQA